MAKSNSLVLSGTGSSATNPSGTIKLSIKQIRKAVKTTQN
jgi:hypothetical protein